MNAAMGNATLRIERSSNYGYLRRLSPTLWSGGERLWSPAVRRHWNDGVVVSSSCLKLIEQGLQPVEVAGQLVTDRPNRLWATRKTLSWRLSNTLYKCYAFLANANHLHY